MLTTSGLSLIHILALQEYNFSWEYIKGTDNKVPDTLSRVDVIENKTGRDLKAVSYTHLDVYKRQHTR